MNEEPRSRWLPLAGVVFLSAVIVGLAFVPAPHNGGDNAGYVTLAYSLVSGGGYVDLFDPAGLPHTKYPPVFPGLLAVLILLGARTWTALKAIAAVSTVAAVAFTYLWTERRLGRVPAFCTALLLSMSSAVVYYSHWILSDTFFLAATMAALWALDRADEEGAAPKWLIAGAILAGVAYFTRSAGLPLVVALLGWLGLRKRWRLLAGVAIGIGVPALAWWWRGRGEGVAQYGTEFWLVDPYQPELGRVGFGGLVGRVVANGWGYLTLHGPGGIVGGSGVAVAAFGVGVTAVAGYGWFLRSRKRIGPAEVFLPAYTGLILLWPEVWSGDRFALPLYPLVLGYSALAFRALGERFGKKVEHGVAVGAVLLIVIPSGMSWSQSVRDASACSAATRVGGPWACYGQRITDFAGAAGWIGGGVPEGSSVMTRKPRLFYVLSGVPSRTFPFTDDPAAQLAEADRVGARYALLDQWDGLSARYVGGALGRQPTAFCSVRGFGQASQGIGTHLLGIMPPGARGEGGTAGGNAEVRIAGCGEEYRVQGVPDDYSSSSSSRIPLLDRLDP